jgi:dihydroxyacetone kinase DhaKLM complex PTS-EIIA-like component DhaM
MSDDMETIAEEVTDALEHTHEDGVTHSHEGGDQEHNHEAVPNFNLHDLAAVKQIIEVSSRRGAYNAAELSAVGATYDRLMAFLQHHVPAPETPTENDDTPTAEIDPPADEE